MTWLTGVASAGEGRGVMGVSIIARRHNGAEYDEGGAFVYYYDVVEQLTTFRIANAALAERVRELEKKLHAAIALAGVVSMELSDVIGIAHAHGFNGWPEHVVVGDQLMLAIGLSIDEIREAGSVALKPPTEPDGGEG